MDIVREFDDAHRAYWADFTFVERTFTAPEETDAGIEPANAIVTAPVDERDLGLAVVRVAWKPNEIDVAHLAQGGTIWLSCWGGLPPHQIEVQGPS